MSAASMFQKTAADMIKGVRAHPRDEASYIAVCITEIKEELKAGIKEQLKAEHEQQLAEIKEELKQLAVALAKKGE